MRVVSVNKILSVRLGFENLGEECLGPWYGGSGAIRLRQELATWFKVYELDDTHLRGIKSLSNKSLKILKDKFPSCMYGKRRKNIFYPNREEVIHLDLDELSGLETQATYLSTSIVDIQDVVRVIFGDFCLYAANDLPFCLFHWKDNIFNFIKPEPVGSGINFSKVSDSESFNLVRDIFPSAKFKRNKKQTFVILSDSDLVELSLKKYHWIGVEKFNFFFFFCIF